MRQRDKGLPFPRSGQRVGFVVGFVLLGVVLPLLYLDQPLHFDEEIYLVIGEQIQEGSTLYVDFLDHKPPAIFYVAATVTEFVAEPHRGLRLLTYAATAVSGLIVYHIGQRIHGRTVGMVATLLFLASTYLPHFDGFFYMTEQWAVLSTLVAAALLLDGRPVSNAIAGVALGFGVLFNQAVFLFGLAVIAFHAIEMRYSQNRSRAYLSDTVRRLLTIGGGFAVPAGLTLAWFYSGGRLDELLYFTIILPLTSYQPPFAVAGHVLALLSLLPLWLLAAWVILRVGFDVVSGDRVDDSILFVTLWALFLSYPGMTSFVGDHKLLLIFPPIGLLSAIGTVRLVDRLRPELSALSRPFDEGDGGSISPTAIVAVVLLATVALSGGVNVVYASERLDSSISEEAAAVQSVDQHVEGMVYTYPPKNHLYYHSDTLEPAPTFLGTSYSDSLADQVITDLDRNEVPYVVVGKGHLGPEREIRAKGYFRDKRVRVVEYLNQHYEPFAETSQYVIFRRVDGEAVESSSGETTYQHIAGNNKATRPA